MSQSLRIQVSIRTPGLVGLGGLKSLNPFVFRSAFVRHDERRSGKTVSIPSYSGQHSYRSNRHHTSTSIVSQSLRIQVSIRTVCFLFHDSTWARSQSLRIQVSIRTPASSPLSPTARLNPFVFRSAFVLGWFRSRVWSSSSQSLRIQVSIRTNGGTDAETGRRLNPFVFRSAFVPPHFPKSSTISMVKKCLFFRQLPLDI